ncbi:MAG: hypothetical protein A3F43_02840 [Gammaproteobacteria bacterium RIFCSPHIGHO2_12_FULL_42_10]|nr:MAG: hypothetical protein A3F43_02840 [Gammaproteobacteria bacterium RIFCSPHIGHO2_12_FULL_42_10]
MASYSLVVGAGGNIGSALFTRLLAAEEPVFGTTHRHPAAPSCFYLNLLDESSLWQFPDVQFDVAYLTAGVCRIAQCETDPAATRKANIDGMGALVRHLADRGVFIVFLSTNQVFSGERSFELTHAACQPMNEYGRQKAEMEAMIASTCERFAIVRLSKVVEPDMPLIKNWVDQLRQYQLVQAFSDMMLAPVSLRQVVETLIQIGRKKQPGFYHLSGSQDVSYFELVSYIAALIQRPQTLVKSANAIECGLQKNFLPRFTTLDCSSTIALCGKNPPHFRDVLRECFGIS